MTQPSTADAAIYLLAERAREHQIKASRAQIATVYHNAAPTADTVEEAVKIVEQTVFEAHIADALHHGREALRFEDAIEAIRKATEQTAEHDERVCSRGGVMCDECLAAGGE